MENDNGQTTDRGADAGGGGKPHPGSRDARGVADGVRHEADIARGLLAVLRDDIGDDEQAASDAIEGETSLFEAVEKAVDRIAEIDAFCEALKAREENFAARRHRYQHQKDAIKFALAYALDTTGQRKLELPTATVYISKGRQRAVVTDPALIPADYLVPQPPKVDLTALTKALAAGPIPGAELSNPSQILNVRTR